jgi:ribosomal protein S27AE
VTKNYNNDRRACPSCGAPVMNHPPKGQVKRGGCTYTRGKVVELLSHPQPFKPKFPPNIAQMERDLRRRGVL